ncbi:hypothetical protein [Leifsonia sp. NPDC080035]|uniref:Lipoprotein n=1 Tax=Leifsonia sp. NPDC080035 TaxID=3143936 RepID=A0AAU7GCU0_9MICO
MPRSRRAGIALTVVPLAFALSGCSVVAAFTPHVEPAIYDTAKEFKAADTSPIGSPTFIPDDATVIRVDYDTETGAAIMTYASKKLLVDGVCKTQTTAPKPTIDDSWWPVTGIPSTASKCADGWSAFAIGSQVYAARTAAK